MDSLSLGFFFKLFLNGLCKNYTVDLMLSAALYSKVDQEIVKVVQERMKACQQREGDSFLQNCAREIQQFNDVTKNYQSRCKHCYIYL